MKQYQIINAYRMLETLADNENLTEFDQWKIYKIHKLLQPHFEFQTERENAIREKYLPFLSKEGLLSAEKSNEFMKEISNIFQLDVDLDSFVKPQIKLVKGITLKMIEPLEDFIEFTEPI